MFDDHEEWIFRRKIGQAAAGHSSIDAASLSAEALQRLTKSAQQGKDADFDEIEIPLIARIVQAHDLFVQSNAPIRKPEHSDAQ